mgnify:CR=1 FL=1
MSNHISKSLNKFLVISDTAMSEENNEVYAFGPVVKELEFLQFPDEITWIGFRKKKNESHIKVTDRRIKTILLNSAGGQSIFDKLNILCNYPKYFFIILKEITEADKIHVRAPSNPAVIAMILSYFFPLKQFCFKYAGVWVGEASLFYKFQRSLLTRLGNNSKITINGTWPNQPKNVYGFENPCLDTSDRALGGVICESKHLTEKINYCFVGGMNTNKGVKKIIETLETLETDKLGTFHFVGGGPLLEQIIMRARKINHKTIFHGFLPKNQVLEIYKTCHFIILPSKSEGFPKVIGEAMNYGCVPLISKISCIDQYIHHKQNGFLIHPINQKTITNILEASLCITNTTYRNMIKENYLLAKKFTYGYYEHQLVTKIYKS